MMVMMKSHLENSASNVAARPLTYIKKNPCVNACRAEKI